MGLSFEAEMAAAPGDAVNGEKYAEMANSEDPGGGPFLGDPADLPVDGEDPVRQPIALGRPSTAT